MSSWLNFEADSKLHTSSRDRGDGKPITDVMIMGADGQTPVSSSNPLSVTGLVKSESISGLDTAALTITSTAKELKVGTVTMVGRKQLFLYPPATGKVYWGTSTVTSATGIPLVAGDSPVEFVINDKVKVFAVSDGTDREVRVVETK